MDRGPVRDARAVRACLEVRQYSHALRHAGSSGEPVDLPFNQHHRATAAGRLLPSEAKLPAAACQRP